MSTLPDKPNTPRRPDTRPQFPNAAQTLAEMREVRKPDPIDEIAREIVSEGILAADESPTEHALAQAVLDRGATISQLRAHAEAALKANTEAREAFTSLAKVATEQGEQIKRLAETVERRGREIAAQNEALHRKNVQLDALHLVWCTGACEGGMHRYGDQFPLTPEIVAAARRNTERLERRLANLQAKEARGG